MLIVGEKEEETKSVSVRKRDEGDLGSMTVRQLVELLREEGIDHNSYINKEKEE